MNDKVQLPLEFERTLTDIRRDILARPTAYAPGNGYMKRHYSPAVVGAWSEQQDGESGAVSREVAGVENPPKLKSKLDTSGFRCAWKACYDFINSTHDQSGDDAPIDEAICLTAVAVWDEDAASRHEVLNIFATEEFEHTLNLGKFSKALLKVKRPPESRQWRPADWSDQCTAAVQKSLPHWNGRKFEVIHAILVMMGWTPMQIAKLSAQRISEVFHSVRTWGPTHALHELDRDERIQDQYLPMWDRTIPGWQQTVERAWERLKTYQPYQPVSSEVVQPRTAEVVRLDFAKPKRAKRQRIDWNELNKRARSIVIRTPGITCDTLAEKLDVSAATVIKCTAWIDREAIWAEQAGPSSVEPADRPAARRVRGELATSDDEDEEARDRRLDAEMAEAKWRRENAAIIAESKADDESDRVHYPELRGKRVRL